MPNTKDYVKQGVTTGYFIGNLCFWFVPFYSTLWVKHVSKKLGARIRNWNLEHWSSCNTWALTNLGETNIKVTGFENIPKGASFIIISDHRSPADIPVIFEIFKKEHVRFTAKAELADVPVLGPSMKGLGHIFFRRGEVKPGLAVKLAERLVSKISGSSLDGLKENIIEKEKKRVQQKDMKAIHEAVKDLREEGIPFAFIVFVTSHRWTLKHFERIWANIKEGDPRFYNTLLPKAGALKELLKLIHDQLDGVVMMNINYVYDGGERKLDSKTSSYGTMFRGELDEAHVYLEWVPISEVPLPGRLVTEDDEKAYYLEVKAWLLEKWKQVDARVKNWIETGSFTGIGAIAKEAWRSFMGRSSTE